MSIQQSNLRGALLSLASFGVYATHDVIVKFLGGSYSPFQIIFFAGLLGFPLMTIMLMSDRTDGNLIPKHPWWTAIRTVSAVATGLAGFYAFKVLPLAQCYAIFFAMPILITLLAIPILGERIGFRRGIAVVAGLGGVLIVLQPGTVELGLGHLAALSAATTGALTSVIVRKVGKAERSIVLMLYPMVANFLIMGAALPFVYFPMPVFHFGAMALMAALGLIGGLLSIAAYRAAPAVIVAPMQYSQIIWAIFYGWLFFNESMDLNTAIGTAVIIASGIYIVLREGTPAVSTNRPVLENRSRFETGILPRTSLWARVVDRSRPQE
jgi:S-adenosylmethionine uptake transporter